MTPDTSGSPPPGLPSKGTERPEPLSPPFRPTPAAPVAHSRGFGRSSSAAGGQRRSRSSPRPFSAADLDTISYEDHSSAATSPNTVASSLSHAGGRSEGSTRPSSVEVLRSGKGGFDGEAVASRRALFSVPCIGVEPAPGRPRDKGKGRAMSEAHDDVEGYAVGHLGTQNMAGAGLGIGGLTRSFRSESLTALAAAAVDFDHDVGPVFTPIQPRSPASMDAETSDYSSRGMPHDSTKTLRKVASSAAALMSGIRPTKEGNRSPFNIATAETSDAHTPYNRNDRLQAARHHRWLSQPSEETDLASQDPGSSRIREAVRHTTHVTQRRDKFGRLLINHYMRGREIGRGVHGIVYIGKDLHCRLNSPSDSQGEGAAGAPTDDTEDDYQTVAIKVVRRDTRTRSLRRSQHPSNHFGADDRPGGQLQLLRDVDDKLKREIAIMKRLKHDNIVRLFEVIDDVKSKKVFMILEFMEGGQIQWQNSLTSAPLMTVEQARKTFRQVVLGLEYLHHQGIIHRDIKPANLLWTADREVVKISDFGVSHLSSALRRTSSKLSPINESRGPSTTASDDRALRKTEGSPAFMAPELCCPVEATPRATPTEQDAVDYFTQRPSLSRQGTSRESVPSPGFPPNRLISRPLPRNAYRRGERPPVGKGIDIWALGVTLYCLLFGRTPFDAPNEFELFNVIWNKPAILPDFMGADRKPTQVGDDPSTDGIFERDARHLADLLGRLLEKDPRRRITLDQVKTHAWVLSSLERPKHWIDETALKERDTIVVTQDDVANFTRPLSNPSTTLKPLGGVRQSLRNAAIKLGLRPTTSGGIRARTKSVSSTSASACTSPHDGGDTEPAHYRDSQPNSLRVGHPNIRGLSPPASPVTSQTPNGSKRAFSIRHGWHPSKGASPQYAGSSGGLEARPGKIPLDNGAPSVSGSSTASSMRPSPTITRSNSGQHLHLPSRPSQQSRSSSGSPIPPSSGRVPASGAAYARSTSPVVFGDESEHRHGLKEALSRVKQKLAKHSGVLHPPSPAPRRTEEARRRSSLPLVFGDGPNPFAATKNLAPSVFLDDGTVIASRVAPAQAADVFYSDDESVSDLDDDSFSDDDFGDSADIEEHAVASHNGERFLVHQPAHFGGHRPPVPDGYSATSVRRSFDAPQSQWDGYEREEVPGARHLASHASEVVAPLHCHHDTPKSLTLTVPKRSAEHDSRVDEEADSIADTAALQIDIKSRRRRGTAASRDVGD